MFSSNEDFGAWLGANALDGIGRNERAALIQFATVRNMRETSPWSFRVFLFK